MNKQQPNFSERYKELQEFLDRPFAIDMLAPVFGERSVDTLFNGWRGEELTGWYRFRNNEGDSLEFYPEGTYVIRKGSQPDYVYQLRTPKTIGEFIDDMNRLQVKLD